MIGKHNARPPKNTYYGIACTNVSLIKQHEPYSLFYSPMYNREVLNYTHSDINDSGNPPVEAGVSPSAKMLLEREIFIKKWNAFIDDEQLKYKAKIQPPVIKNIP